MRPLMVWRANNSLVGVSPPLRSYAATGFERRTPDWQTAYQAAVLEVDNSKLKEEVDQAEAEIFRRLLILLGTAEDVEECKAIQHALTGLGILRKERLGYTDQA